MKVKKNRMGLGGGRLCIPDIPLGSANAITQMSPQREIFVQLLCTLSERECQSKVKHFKHHSESNIFYPMQRI